MIELPECKIQARDGSMLRMSETMPRMIHLRDLTDLSFTKPIEAPPAVVHQARAALERRNLRLDNRTGRIYDRQECVEHFVHPEDHQPHRSLQRVMDWEFRRYVANSVSRILRGFAP